MCRPPPHLRQPRKRFRPHARASSRQGQFINWTFNTCAEVYVHLVYLNYTGQAEEAFNFYKSVFGTEFIGGIMRHGDVPAMAEG